MPQALRQILEKALSEDASQENLDKYLPSIRDIIVTLLRQLKAKQLLIRSQQSSSQSHPILQRNLSHPSQSHAPSPPPPPQPKAQYPATATSTVPAGYTPQQYQQPRSKSSSNSLNSRFQNPSSASQQQQQPPLQQHAHLGTATASYPKDSTGSVSSNPHVSAAPSTSTTSSSTTQYNHQSKPPYAQHIRGKSSLTGNKGDFELPHPKDPLAALQRGEALERRASRRFSAYQFAKLTNGSSSRTDIPDVPPLPNNGSTSSLASQRKYPNQTVMQGHAAGQRIPGPMPQSNLANASTSSLASQSQFLPTKTPRSTQRAEYTSSTMLVSDGKEVPQTRSDTKELRPQGTLPTGGHAVELPTAVTHDSDHDVDAQQSQHSRSNSGRSATERPLSLIQQQHQYTVQQQQQNADSKSNPYNTDNPSGIVLFLQIGRRVKKCVVDRADLTIPSLRLLFVDKFAYPMASSESVPDIYIQDPTSGIRYELDEDGLAHDVHPGSLLSLNIEVVDEVKKHIDEGFSNISKQILELNSKVESNSSTIKKINDIQEEIVHSSTDVKLGAGSQNPKSPVSSKPSSSSSMKKNSFPLSKSHQFSVSNTPSRTNSITSQALSGDGVQRIEKLRRDVAIVKQISTETIKELKSQLAELTSKTRTLQAVNSLPPPGDSSRAYMEKSFKKLTGDSDRLLTQVDDIQDIVEDLRKDVVQRGVRPKPKHLELVAKDVESSKKDLEAIVAYIQAEKTGWKKIWERELEKICEEQQILKFHEELIADLNDDVAKAAETFELVQQCTNEVSKSLRPFYLPPPVEGQTIRTAKDAVLNEVVALQPNHEQRVEAIERAEKLRKKELQIRGIENDMFLQELGEFVGESKLKKSGGVEETERRLRAREQKAIEESYLADKKMQEEEALAIAASKKKKSKKSSTGKSDSEKKKKKKKKSKAPGEEEGEDGEKKKKKKSRRKTEEDGESAPASDEKGSEFVFKNENEVNKSDHEEDDDDSDSDDDEGDVHSPDPNAMNIKTSSPPLKLDLASIAPPITALSSDTKSSLSSPVSSSAADSLAAAIRNSPPKQFSHQMESSSSTDDTPTAVYSDAPLPPLPAARAIPERSQGVEHLDFHSAHSSPQESQLLISPQLQSVVPLNTTLAKEPEN